jgi:hypothetical protein
MSELISEKLSAPLSGSPETSQVDDLEAMISRLDKKWRQLKELLRVQEHPAPLEQPDGPVSFPDLAPLEEDFSEPEGRLRVDLSPLEANAIVDGMEKLGEEARVLQRLARLERQNRGLTFYAIFCTFLLLGLLFSTLLLDDHAASPPETLRQNPRPPVITGPMALGPPTLSVPESKTSPPGS